MEADFSGWATKYGIKCSDGRVIDAAAFQHMDNKTVPLVWQHQHSDIANVLGHVQLESRPEGMYAYGFFNDTENGLMAKQMVKNKDLESLSIFAKRLEQQGSIVKHGTLTEVSLCKAGANAEARIDNVNLFHGDEIVGEDETEAVIYSGDSLQHEDLEGDTVVDQTETQSEDELAHATATATKTKASAPAATDDSDDSEETVQDVIDSMTDKQKQVMYLVVGEALDGDNDDDDDSDSTVSHSDSTTLDESVLAHIDSQIQEGFTNMRSVFEQNGATTAQTAERKRLTPTQIKTIFDDAERKGSLKESFLAHAAEYGIDDIDTLFPNSQLDSNGVTYVSRRMEWVQSVLDGVHKSPFSRIKSLSADITADEARAKGYIKGNLKKDEIIKMLRRETTPTTIYKKQKLDRDDIVDITDIDILTWIQQEMRLMLDEEVARAILFGDNRESDDDDKIDDSKVRPVAYDIDMYNTTVQVNSTASVSDLIDAIVNGLNNYKGSGTPTLYTTRAVFTKMILSKDTLGRRLYATAQELAAALTVDSIVTVEAMEQNSDLFAVVVNLADYTVGADKGGEINLFDFFDIDYNQQKYLLETRISGCLTKPKSAVTFVLDAANVVTPQAPTFVNSTGVVTIPNQTGVVYTNEDTGATLNAGAQPAIAVGQTLNVLAQPAPQYGFTAGSERQFVFSRTA